MSLVAKVFVVLNLLVSVSFLVFSMNVWTAQTKWQKMYELEKIKSVEAVAKSQKPIVELSQSVVRGEQQISEQKRLTQEMKMRFNEERDKVLQLNTKLAVAENARDMKDAENQEITRELKRTYDDMAKLKGVIIKQQQALVVERDNGQRARNEKSEMESELNVVKQTLATVERDKRNIESDLALATSRLEGLMARGVPIIELLGVDAAATQPYVDAQVLAVRPDVGLVMLSAGSQQNVKAGYQFTISRGDKYIGKVQVDRVYPDMCSAKIVGAMTQETIEVHDEARTK